MDLKGDNLHPGAFASSDDADQHQKVDNEITENKTEPTNGSKDNVEKRHDPTVSDEVAHQYATPKELSILSTVFTIATFMIAIDGSILATAIPSITSDFHRLDDAPWYGSAYLLTEMSFQPTFGRLYSLFDPKILYLISIAIFETGSILSAAAPNSAALIVGRVISGAGAAGLLCGSLAIYGQSVPLRARPFGMALVTSMYGIAGVLGPTVGGLITDTPKLTWRFCFWINVPAGVVTFAIACWGLKRKIPIHGRLSLVAKFKKLDMLGGALLTTGLIALFFALQWGGSKYPWSNPRVFSCLIVCGIFTSAFIFLQIKKKEEAIIPVRIISQRTVAISCAFNFLMSIAHSTHIYYLAFYFQSVLGTNAVTSGVRCLAYGIPCSIAILVTGACITSKGYYVPFMWLGTSIFLSGCVLLRELGPDSPMGKWLGFQVITGAGIGLAEQVPFIAVQVVLPDADMPTACALVIFFRCLGGAIGLSIAYNIFSSALLPKLMQAPGVQVDAILNAGASDLAGHIPSAVLPLVRKAFGFAVSKTFLLPVIVASLSLLLSLGMQRRWIPDDRKENVNETLVITGSGETNKNEGETEVGAM